MACAIYAVDTAAANLQSASPSRPRSTTCAGPIASSPKPGTRAIVLYDGAPDADEVERLRANVPLQEAGRYRARDLVLARANKSVRLFDEVVGRWRAGGSPTPDGS